ncbi:uncharacterized protein LOC119953850 isoform X1 [Scyliorhinus canicula]|uniref:uncharacterized protein LOC119953850 isoform X1 n=2 Tax=Scyliorhinus canicula TaxID=7830 RepID=UPI0018F329BD|nr:uncharacterized protein LOC119953850 isoform X1 [Scyliorhinus canicula]XP_038634344.1 uncharacterized protein LOC119953850 isoform X1 [Scyliorhinus canicula]XP_038634345.1 uncharacterized protein LOC119953850 isoform X1 [Scyliorhinus canicula]XP_038634346.1 uncharacterized protein LOC119953850 isoform X1 [Scyliorhinus canicula]
MGNYTTNLFKTPEAKRLPADKGFVSFNRDSDDQSFSASCQHAPRTGSEVTLGDEWFNYEMLEYYVPTPHKAKVNRGTKRAKTRTKQIYKVPLLTNLVVDSSPTAHGVMKKNIVTKSPSAPAVLVSSPSAKRLPEKNAMSVKKAARSNLVTSKQSGRTVPTEQSPTDALDAFLSPSNVDATTKEAAPNTSSSLSQDVTLRPIVTSRNTSAWLSLSAPAAIVSELPVETSFAKSADVLSDASTSDLTGKLQPEYKAKPSKYAVEVITAKKTDSELGTRNEDSLTEVTFKRVNEGCLGRTATQLLATFKSCIGIENNGFVAYSVSYILKSASSHENLIRPT